MRKHFSVVLNFITFGIALYVYLTRGPVINTASAEEKPGLWWTTKTKGLASVQKLSDTSNGVICYVASNEECSTSSPSISCVKP